jgi:hypothetical protein
LTPTFGPIGSPTPLSPNFNPGVGATIVNPIIDCNADPVNNTTGAVGIIVDEPNTTIINPSIRECIDGIRVQKKNGVMPTNVRIIADDRYVGYAQTNFTLDREGIYWIAGNGEVGDVSASDTQVGGAMKFIDNYRYFHGVLTTGFRMHHTTSRCSTSPCVRWSNSRVPGAHWGLKFLADRPLGAPYEASHVRFDHNSIEGVGDESISFDSRGNVTDRRSNAYAGTVSAVSAPDHQVSLIGYSTSENLVGQWVTFNEGGAKGRSVEIIAGSNNLTVADPNDYLADVSVGDRATVGVRFFEETIDHNSIDLSGGKTAIDFHGSVTYSTVAANAVQGLPSFCYSTAFHTRYSCAPQCMMIRSLAGPYGVPAFSFFNTVTGNSCDGSGDITASVVSWGTYEVDSPTYLSGDVFAGLPLGQEWPYKCPAP